VVTDERAGRGTGSKTLMPLAAVGQGQGRSSGHSGREPVPSGHGLTQFAFQKDRHQQDEEVKGERPLNSSYVFQVRGSASGSVFS